MRELALALLVLGAICLSAGASRAESQFPPGLESSEAERIWNEFDGLLGRVVKNDLVDYALLAGEAGKLEAFLGLLGQVRPEGMSREQSLAFHIDLYNAATLQLILTAYPDLQSIKDLGSWFESPWSVERVAYAGGRVSLDHLEHEVLRRRFADPRVHFALNCSALSCPPLLAELYAPARVDEQLDTVTRTFINNPEAVFVRDGELHVSRIFRWYSEDFDPGILEFVRRWAAPELLRALDKAAEAGKVRVRYLAYDWSLNDVARAHLSGGAGQ